MENFVEIVGYQLEKIHTGVIKWCLELNEGETVSLSKYEAICNLYKKIGKVTPFKIEEIKQIKGVPEFSFGRLARIDLVVKISLNSEDHYLVCEMKVDSDPYVRQLDNTVKLSNEKFITKNIDYLLILLGCSSVSREIGDNHRDFHSIDCADLIEIFKPQENDSFIVSQWFDALRSEIGRGKESVENYKRLYPKKVKSKQAHKDLGYRPLFSLYYYLYSYFRTSFSCGNEWRIYSGSNNPVMNWSKGWETIGAFNFYWEFNYLEYCLKVRINKDNVSKCQLNKLRSVLNPLIKSFNIGGKAAQKRYGKWNTIYKWEFSPSTKSIPDICSEIENKIHPIYPEILKACSDSITDITSA